MLKAKELINLSDEELKAQYQELSKEIFELLSALKLARKLEKPHLLREKRRDRARIMTVLRQKMAKG